MWEIWNGTSSTTTVATYYTSTTGTSSCSNQMQNAVLQQYYGSLYNRSQSITSSTYNGLCNYGAYAYESPAAWLDRQRRTQAAQLQRHPQEARDRALDLLLSHLTPAQQETFKKNKWFVVEGSKSKRRYRIHANDNVAANIDVLDGDRTTERLCGHCDIAAVPLGDHVLAQKIMIESDEDAFLRIANRHAA